MTKSTIVYLTGCKQAEGKPRIRRNSQGLWRCFDDTYFQTFGKTPEEAYLSWNTRRHILTIMPRRGYWNMRDTKAWASKGCPSINSWIGNKQEVGYIWATDELVLRG